MKLMERMKTVHSFLRVMSKLFHPISACPGSFASDREKIFRNPLQKLVGEMAFIFNQPRKLVSAVQRLKPISFSFGSACSNCKYALRSS